MIHDLEKLIITFADDVVYVAVKLADGIKHFVLKTLAQIGDCIEVFLQAVASIAKKVVNAIKTVIKWLRLLFGWEDIIRTKKVVSYYIDQTLKNLANDFTTTIPKDLIAAFNKAKMEIVTVFDNLEDLFEAGVGFNAMGPSSSSDPAAKGGPPYEGVGANTAYKANSVRCNYVHSKMNHSAASVVPHLTAASAPASFDPSQILHIFEQTFPTAQLEQSWQRIQAFDKKIHDAKSFLEVAVLDLMEAIKDMVLLILSGIEAVLVAISEIAGGALAALDALMTAKIHIPIISQIYKWIAKADLMMLDLFSLIIAVPATILYKLLYGGSSLKPPFSEAEVQAILNNPIPWPSFAASKPSKTVRAAALSLPEATPADKALAILFLFSAMGYMVLDIGLDIQAASEADSGGGETTAAAFTLPDPTVVAGIVSIVISVAMQGFGVPYGAMKRIDDNEGTSADTWAIVAWCTAWLPPLLDTVFAIGSKSKKVTRLQPTVGPFLSMAAGIVMIGCGAKAVHEMRQDTTNYNVSNQAAVLLPTFPYIFQPIVLAGIDSPPTLAAQVVLWLIDVAGDFGTGIAALVALSPDDASELVGTSYASV